MTMKMKLFYLLRNFLRALFLSLFFIPLFVSCKSTESEYTKCEEMCEYSKRDCIEGCENYNSFGVSVDFGRSGFGTPYACTERCDKVNVRCLAKCGEKSTSGE